MSEAAKKHRELHGEFSGKFIDDPKACGMSFYIVGEYEYLVNRFSNASEHQNKKVAEICGQFTFSMKTEKVLPGACFAMNGHLYKAIWIDNIIECLGRIERVEEWTMSGYNDDGTSMMIHSIVFVDASGDCGILAEWLDDDAGPPEQDDIKFADDGWLEEELQEAIENGSVKLDKAPIISTIEDRMTCTFDPFDF